MLTVISLGNKLRGDDGIGPHIIEYLRQHESAGRLNLVDAAADAFTVLNHLIENGHIVVIDSARMNKEPGFVQKIKLDTASLSWADENLSVHGFGFGEIYQIARALNPCVSCTLIAVEPNEIVFNTKLSDAVLNSVPRIIKLVIEELEKYVEEENINN